MCQGDREEPYIESTHVASLTPSSSALTPLAHQLPAQLLLRYQCDAQEGGMPRSSVLFFSPTLAVPGPPYPPGSEVKRSGKGSQHLNERPLSPHPVMRGVEGCEGCLLCAGWHDGPRDGRLSWVHFLPSWPQRSLPSSFKSPFPCVISIGVTAVTSNRT